MPDFSVSYLPPGIYVESSDSPIVAVVGAAPTVVALLGPSIGYRVHSEQVVLTSTTAVALAKLGIDPDNGFEVRLADGTLVPSGDYTLVPAAGVDADIDETEDNLLTIARTGGSGISSGATVYLTYRYTDMAFRQPQTFTDYDDVKDFFGEPFDTVTGDITSPLSLAAKFSMENGARRIVLVSTEDDATLASRAGLDAAHDKLAGLFDVNVVVPLPVGLVGTEVAPADVLNVGTDLASGVEDTSDDADAIFRIGILGYETGVTVEPGSIAAAVSSRRVVYLAPHAFNYYNGALNQTVRLGGYYLAAAVGGLLASQEPQESLTQKQVRSFSGIPSDLQAVMTTSVKNAWAAAGVAVVEVDRSGRLVVRHGLTTDMTSIVTREVSLVRGRDAMVQSLDTSFRFSGLIGSPIDSETALRVKNLAAGALEALKAAGTIFEYRNLKVRQTSADPSVIEIKYEYSPTFPLNYIVIAYTLNVNTASLVAA